MLGHRSWKAIDPSRANPKIARYALLFVVVALLAGFFRLSISNDPSRLLSSNSERFEAYASILQNFPGEQNQILIYTRAQAFAPDHLKAYKSVLTPLSDISGVAAVYSLYSSTSLGNALDQVSLDPKKAQKSGLLTDLKALLSQRDFMLSRLVSDEFDALLMAVTLSADAKPKSVISTIKTVLGDSYPAESGIVWTLAGNPVIAETLSQDTLWELLRVTAVAMIFGIGVACWFFKNLASVLQVVIVPTVAVACTLGAMAWLGISLNLLTQTVLVVVFLVVFTDSLHTVHGGRSPQSLILACALTSLTTAASAAALLFAGSTVMQEFGMAMLAGIFVGFLVWLLWLLSGYFSTKSSLARTAHVCWPKTHLFSHQRLLTTILISFVLLLLPASQLRTGFSLFENIPRSHNTAEALALAENQFSGYLPLQVMASGLNKSETTDEFLTRLIALQDRLNNQKIALSGQTIHWYSIADVLSLAPGFSNRHRLRALPRVLRQSLWNVNKSAILFAPIRIESAAHTSAEFFTTLDEEITQTALEEGIALSVVTGFPALVQEASQTIMPDAIRSFSITFAVLSLVVFCALKSWKLAAIASIPVAFGVTTLAAALVLLGEPLRHAGVVMLTLVLGLSIDNAMHLIVSRECDKSHTLVATERCLPVLWVATMAIVSGFIALTFSHIPSVSMLGLATAIALASSFMASALWVPQFLET